MRGFRKGKGMEFLTTLCPSAAGCSRTHSAVTLGDWSDPLDPDAETQMVYRQLLLGRDQLRWAPHPSRLTPYDRLGQPPTVASPVPLLILSMRVG